MKAIIKMILEPIKHKVNKIGKDFAKWIVAFAAITILAIFLLTYFRA